jgi:hypothetical protein
VSAVDEDVSIDELLGLDFDDRETHCYCIACKGGILAPGTLVIGFCGALYRTTGKTMSEHGEEGLCRLCTELYVTRECGH